jgi:tmRNA-binding protein
MFMSTSTPSAMRTITKPVESAVFCYTVGKLINCAAHRTLKSIIPLRIYGKGGLIKIQIAICTGKRNYDKRQDVKKREQMREIERSLKKRI